MAWASGPPRDELPSSMRVPQPRMQVWLDPCIASEIHSACPPPTSPNRHPCPTRIHTQSDKLRLELEIEPAINASWWGATSTDLSVVYARPRLYSKLEIEPAIHAYRWGTGSTYCSAVKCVRYSGIAHDHTHIVYVITCGCSAWLAGQVLFAFDGESRPPQRAAMHKGRLPASIRQR